MTRRLLVLAAVGILTLGLPNGLSTAWGAQVYRHGVVYVGDMTRGLDVFVFEPLARKRSG
ncbi:MAG: hypothetical protein ACRDT4_22095 [Micromonosporaceae bacterium]